MTIQYERGTGIRIRAAKAIILGCISLGALTLSSAATITVTITGTAQGGDDYGIFGVGRSFKDQEFSLTFTFDDSANPEKVPNEDCSGFYSKNSGSASASPATAVLTIGNGSFTYGSPANSSWSVGRFVASRCSKNEIFINMDEGVYPQSEGFNLHIVPADGKPAMTDSLDWQSPFAETEFDNDPRNGSFLISHPHDFQRVTKGNLFVKTVTVQ